MGRTKAASDERFEQAWQGAESLGQVTTLLGISKSRASNRASLMRGRGTPLKKFKSGPDSYQVPIVFQLRRWEWVRLVGGRREHRRRPGAATALCGTKLPDSARVVRVGLRPCPNCWPVHGYPKMSGPIPDDVEFVVIHTSSTTAELVQRSGDQFLDVETAEPVADKILTTNLGWWAVG